MKNFDEIIKRIREIRVELGDIETKDREADSHLGAAEEALFNVCVRLKEINTGTLKTIKDR